MKKYIILFFLTLISLVSAFSQSLAEKLGYKETDKLLIIHADDLGVAHSQNIASFLAMKTGPVNSSSIMMPCPWVSEVAEFAQKNPNADLGLHLTMTNEWKHMNWGPLASKDKVPSLINEFGFLYDNCLSFGQKAKVEEAEIELRAQIDQAIEMGIRPTHLDTHMGCLVFNSPELFEVYLKLGREYKIPVMVGRLFVQAASPAFKEKITKDDIIIESILTANVPDYESGMAAYYEKTLRNLSSGVNVLLIHLAFNNTEMQAVTIGKEPWGALWRQQDFDFFTSTKCKEIIEDEEIQLVTWREIQKVMYPE
ncbi:MAG: polysaccharide deacetylase family protein [Saprospiraceae bacterium]|nr:polysaccharide deacetylase family protein [Saprospiraceae bacterium]